MIAKNPNDLIKEYATQGIIPVEDLQLMINGFYRKIKHKAIELEHWNIRIRGIGDLRGSFKKVSTDYYKYLKQKTIHEKDKSNPLYKEAVNKLKLLSKMMGHFRKEKEKEKKANRKKREYHITKVIIARNKKLEGK